MNDLSVFLNTSIENAGELARIGDLGLTPYRYLFKGQTIRFIKDSNFFHHVESFHERGNLNFSRNDYAFKSAPKTLLRTMGAITLLIPGLLLSIAKVFSFAYVQTRARHSIIKTYLTGDRLAEDPYKTTTVTLPYFNAPARVKIAKTINFESQTTFTAYYTYEQQETEIGHITCEWVRNFPNGDFGSEACMNVSSEYSKYGYGHESRVDKIWVDYLESRYQSFKGLGKTLMQAAMEYGYSKRCWGRINLVAGVKSHGFYYKLGMRIGKEELDAMIEKNLTVIPRPYFMNISMHMTDEGRASWKERIRSNPIYPETAKYLGADE